MQVVLHISDWCTWLAHTLYKGLIWNYKKCWAQPWLSFGILQALWRSWECIRYSFWLIQDFVLKFWHMHFGWWCSLMKNKNQTSLYLGLKMANILQITFSNGFSFKKLTVFLSVFLSVCLSVCLSVPATPFSLCLHHGTIMKFSGVITNDWSHVYANV